MWEKLTFLIDCSLKARLWFFTTPNQCILTHVGARSLTHAQRKPLCDFLSCGFRFSNKRRVVSAAPSASHWAPRRFLQQQKTFWEALCAWHRSALPLWEAFVGSYFILLFFLNSCKIEQWGGLKPWRPKTCRVELGRVVARVNATTWGLGVTAGHGPNDNLGLVVEYASHVIFVPGNSSNRRSLIWYSPSDFLIKYWISHLQITALNHIFFSSSKREINSHSVQDHQGHVNILCYFLQYLFWIDVNQHPWATLVVVS